MNRKHTARDYVNLIDRIRKASPDIALSTDVIVGFPGETEEDFEETLSAVREVGFADAFTFIFSMRDGTPATRLPADMIVPEQIASDRMARLIETVRGMSRERNLTLLGQRYEVLVEKGARRGDLLQARTRDFKTVLLPGDDSMIGRYFNVELTGTTGSTFTGTIVRDRQPLPMAG
jgi:tRNA-2-methylthio-N6-dimethylallyladenosine synthase